MARSSQLSPLGWTFVLSVIVAGATTIAFSLYEIHYDPPLWTWLILAALTLISGTFAIEVPTISVMFSVSEIFVFTAVLLYGAPAATLIVALDGLILNISSATRRPERFFFNIAEPALSVWIPSQLFFLLVGIPPMSRASSQPDIVLLLLPIAGLATCYFLLNSWFNALAIGFTQRTSPFALWKKHFVWLCLNYFGGASVAILLVRNGAKGIDSVGFAAIVPLLFISYLTQKYSGGRLEDATRHIKELNLLHLSTIETLAMAIDAKDQITHGHIRRVQLYAVGLAKKLGVTGGPILQAIEAAALLHDTGKLAVPEYILNKPGKLTAAEFEKMKLHATVGADILSSIDFPYPVVPIVRHHHESWDGSGYPDGLRSTDIPLGARILAVVDCFDALTSDRPYRGRLSDGEALKILLERRGTMYDPLVIDTFLDVYEEIGPTEIDAQMVSTSLRHIADSSRQAAESSVSNGLADIAASSEEMLALFDLARALSGRTSLTDACDVIAKHLRRLTPSAVAVFFVYDSSRDELVVRHASPDLVPVVGIRIRNGEGIAGWVAANRETILNSDPALDFGDVVRSNSVALSACLSTPLVVDENLVGVLSLCSAAAGAFTDDHRRLVEAVEDQISRVVRDSLTFDLKAQRYRDAATGLPNAEWLEALTAGEGVRGHKGRPLSVLFFHLQPATRSNRHQAIGESAVELTQIASRVRRVLRAADVLFRYGDTEFVVMLSQTDYDSATAIGERIRSAVRASCSDLEVRITIRCATFPDDGASLGDLVATAKLRVATARASVDGDCSATLH
jgi:diguanylate cyclase (GGDEF)-like protein/putative nucleotidyltransferase with HDIG domain